MSKKAVSKKQNKTQENLQENNIFKIIVHILDERDSGALNCVGYLLYLPQLTL